MIVDRPGQRRYDVIIIGSGPAGITTALELARTTSLRIAIIESGLLDAHATIQNLARVELHGDLTEDYFPMHTQRCFGGSSTIWGGYCAVLEQRAFLDGSWPISYDEVARWYPRAAEIIELPDNAWQRPVVAIAGTSEIVYKPFYLSPPTRFNLKYHDDIEQHPRIELILGLTCARLIHADRRVQAVELQDSLDPQAPRSTLAADRVVVACGGVGNPRLMQLSGIGAPLPVGQGLMEHPHLYAVANMYLNWERIGGVLDTESNAVHALQPSDDFCVAHNIHSLSADFNLLQTTPEALLGKTQDTLYTPVTLRAEIPADLSNRIGAADQSNYLGQPMTRIDFHYRFREQAQQTWNLFAQALLRSGLGRPSTLKPDFQLHSGGHIMGTTRMGADATDSVVDRDCRVHTLDNLYVAGSSVFPAGGASNPTYTIVALALRLGDHLARTHAPQTKGSRDG